MIIDGERYGIPEEYEITDAVAQRIMALGEVFGRDDPVLIAYINSTLGIDAINLPTAPHATINTEEEFAAALAREVRLYRSNHSLTQYAMAEHCGLRPSHIMDWERGRAYPSAEAYGKLSRKLGLSMEYVPAKNSRVRTALPQYTGIENVDWPHTTSDDPDTDRAALFARWSACLSAYKRDTRQSDRSIAAELGVGNSTVSAWRRNSRPPSLASYAKVCRLTGFTEPYLLSARPSDPVKANVAPPWYREVLQEYLDDYDVGIEELAELFDVSYDLMDAWAYGDDKPPTLTAARIRDLCCGRLNFSQLSSRKAPATL